MYDCVIVGGGIAGMQAAIQLGRYQRSVAVLDRGDGRSAVCRSYRNILGWPDGISGARLREIGRGQSERLGVIWQQADVTGAERLADGSGFRLRARDGRRWEARSLLLSTGVMDRLPDLPGLPPCLGQTVYVCPDCDGHEVRGRRTIVLGTGNAGAGMAQELAYFTDHLLYVNHQAGPISDEQLTRLRERGIAVVQGTIVEVLAEGDGVFRGIRLQDGRIVEGERGFVAFGGNEVRSALAASLGADLADNGHILADPRTKRTNVEGLWAAGDLGLHSEQVTIAMGEGSQAAIWIHKTLLAEELAAGGADGARKEHGSV